MNKLLHKQIILDNLLTTTIEDAASTTIRMLCTQGVSLNEAVSGFNFYIGCKQSVNTYTTNR